MKPEPIKIAFRVDADTHIGTGHLMEVISMFRAIQKMFHFHPLVITRRSKFTVDKLKSSNIRNFIFIPKAMPEIKEAAKVVAILHKENCGNLVTDLLDYSNNYYKYLNSRLRNLFVILDANGVKEVPAAVAVNFSITQNKKFYADKNKGGTDYLIGPEYFPFNRQITKLKPITVKDDVERIFLNMGGGDPYGLTAKVIKALLLFLKPSVMVHVLLGGAFKPADIARIKKMKPEIGENFNFHSNIPQEKVYALMANTDLAITAAGNTLYELAYFGIPSIVLSHHLRHLRVAEAFRKQKAIISLGIGAKIPGYKIAQAVKGLIVNARLRRELSFRIKNIVSAEGTSRICSEILRHVRSHG